MIEIRLITHIAVVGSLIEVNITVPALCLSSSHKEQPMTSSLYLSCCN